VETHIVEKLASFINDGILDSEMIHMESEHSALSAALGASATGVRTFSATASQGLALMHEILFVVSGMRLPVVMSIANRSLSAPINIWNDHQDSISARDSGWMQFYAESSQEALDTMIIAYKIAENKDVLLPAMVCIDGFTLSHVYEPVDIPEQKSVDRFLSPYKPVYKLDPEKPLTMGPVGFPDSFMYFKHAQQKAMESALQVIKKVNTEFKQQFGRDYGDGILEGYKMNDAKQAVVCMGSVCGTVRVAVDKMRNDGKKVGMIKLKTYRPFPKKRLVEVSKGLKGMAVLDKNISFGNYGALFTDLKAVLSDKIKMNNFIIGLGGRDITVKHVEEVVGKIGSKKDIEWVY
jgi:pyruvate ferredoxin oxidoreductase alpha subunit